MIKITKKFISILMCGLMLFSVGCARGEPTISGFTDTKTNIEYVDVTPMGLYPVAEGEEYLTVLENKVNTVYYSVENEEPARFLCYKDEENLFLVRAKDIVEPSAANFNPVAAHVYNATNMLRIDTIYANFEYIPDEYLSGHSSDDDYGETELCKQIERVFAEGEEQNPGITSDNISDIFYLHMLSPDYPGLYYLVSFFKFEGRYYLRDSAANKTVFCPYDVIVRMVGADDV